MRENGRYVKCTGTDVMVVENCADALALDKHV
jgi:hypothetical protein